MFFWARKIIRENCGENGKYWRLKEDLYRGYLSKDWKIGESVPGELLLPHYEKPTTMIKVGSSVTAAMVGGPEDGFFLKRYNFRNVKHSLKRLFQYPRVYRCLAMSLKMKQEGIDTPEVFAAVCYRRGILPGQSFLTTRQLGENAKMLDLLATEAKDLEAFRYCVDGVVELLAKMHAAGIVHGDLSLRNIYCVFGKDGKPERFGVLDLDGSRYCGRVPAKRLAYELARVISSYCRCVRNRRNKAQLNDVAEVFMTAYREKAGVPIDGNIVLSRASYLLERRRRRRR